MNPEQTAALLAYAAAVDPRIRRNDPEERRLQVQAWAAQLANVDQAAARQAVDAHYARPGAGALMPGDVRSHAAGSAQDRLPSSRPLAESVAASDRADAADTPQLEAAERVHAEQSKAEIASMLKRISDRWAMPSPTGYTADRHAPRREQAQRIPAPLGAATTLCHGPGCAADIAAPPGWDPADPRSPQLYCAACQPPATPAAGKVTA